MARKHPFPDRTFAVPFIGLIVADKLRWGGLDFGLAFEVPIELLHNVPLALGICVLPFLEELFAVGYFC